MLLRKIDEEDYDEVDRLMQQVHEIHVKNRPDLYAALEHPLTLLEFRERLHSNNVISVLAEENGHAVGICFAAMREKTCMKVQKTAYMEELCVDRTYRRQGIGRRLFDYVEKAAKEKGAIRLDLMVWNFPDSAVPFYESLGMKPQRYIMEKEL